MRVADETKKKSLDKYSVKRIEKLSHISIPVELKKLFIYIELTTFSWSLFKKSTKPWSRKDTAVIYIFLYIVHSAILPEILQHKLDACTNGTSNLPLLLITYIDSLFVLFIQGQQISHFLAVYFQFNW